MAGGLAAAQAFVLPCGKAASKGEGQRLILTVDIGHESVDDLIV